MMVKQITEYLQIDEHTIYKLARRSQIPSLKIAGQLRFKKEIIDKWMGEEYLGKGNKKYTVFFDEKRQGEIIYG